MPQPLGTYSQAIKVDSCVYHAGMIGIDPDTGELISDSCRAQLRQIFINLSKLCQASGGELADIVQLTCYLTSLDDFSLVNEVMAEFFPGHYPARATLAVSALPKAARVEIVSIMHLPLC